MNKARPCTPRDIIGRVPTSRKALIRLAKSNRSSVKQEKIPLLERRRSDGYIDDTTKKFVPYITQRHGMTAKQADKELRSKMQIMSKEVRRVFRRLDEDSSGTLDHDEFRKMLEHLNMHLSNAEFGKLIRMYDPDGNGISYREFLIAFATEIVGGDSQGVSNQMFARNEHLKRETKKKLALIDLKSKKSNEVTAEIADRQLRNKMRLMSKEVRRIFRRIDKDGSGMLDHDEFRTVLTSLHLEMTDREFAKLCARYDPNNDGISYREFLKEFGKEMQGGDTTGVSHHLLSRKLQIQAETDKAIELHHQAVETRTLKSARDVHDDLFHRMHVTRNEMCRIFRKYDEGATGIITYEQFREMLSTINLIMSDREFARLVAEYDPRNIGISWRDNFLHMIRSGRTTEGLNDAMMSNIEIENAKIRMHLDAQEYSDNATLLNAEEADRVLKAKMHIMDNEIGRIFRRLDEDSSGTLDRDEFRNALVMLNLKMSDSEYTKLMNKYDPDGNGITYREFLLQFGEVLQASDGNGGLSDVMHQKALRSREKIVKNSATILARMTADQVHEALVRVVATMATEVRRAFRKLDEDASGALSHAEFRRLLEGLNLYMVNDEFKKLMARYDPDHDGIQFKEFMLAFGLDYESQLSEIGTFLGTRNKQQARKVMLLAEKQAALVDKHRSMTAEQVHEELTNKIALMRNEVGRAFRFIDENANGVLSHEEFRALLDRWNISITPPEFKRLMDRYDPNHDGISYREFVAMFGQALQGTEQHSSLANKMFTSRRHSMARRHERMVIHAGQMKRDIEVRDEARRKSGIERVRRSFVVSTNQETDAGTKLPYFRNPAPPSEGKPGNEAARTTRTLTQPETEDHNLRAKQIVRQIANLLKTQRYQHRLLISACRQYDPSNTGHVSQPQLGKALWQLGIRMGDEDKHILFQNYASEDRKPNYKALVKDLRKAAKNNVNVLTVHSAR